MNINNNTLYRVRKTVPQRYRETLKKLEQTGYVLRKMHPRLVATDFMFEGVILNLVYKTRNTINDKYGEWKVKEQYNPLETNNKNARVTEEIRFNSN